MEPNYESHGLHPQQHEQLPENTGSFFNEAAHTHDTEQGETERRVLMGTDEAWAQVLLYANKTRQRLVLL